MSDLVGSMHKSSLLLGGQPFGVAGESDVSGRVGVGCPERAGPVRPREGWRIVPSNVANFSELHEYVNANCYGGAVELFGEIVTESKTDDEHLVKLNSLYAIVDPAVQAVDAWIKAGGIETALTLERLAAPAGRRSSPCSTAPFSGGGAVSIRDYIKSRMKERGITANQLAVAVRGASQGRRSSTSSTAHTTSRQRRPTRSCRYSA